MLDAGRKAMGIPVTYKYSDPEFQDPRTRKKKRAHGVGSGRFTTQSRKLSAVPPCDPGTITYHDMLVRHFGHRFANDFRRRFIASVSGSLPRSELVLPTKQEFSDNPPWAWRTS